MSFKLGAYVLNLKKGGGSWAIDDLKSIGIWEGSELINSGSCPPGTLTGITSQFESTNKAYSGKPKPMTFTWDPPKQDKMLFHSILRKATFHMRIGVTREEKDNRFSMWTLTFDEVKLVKSSKKGKIERVDATYMTFRFEPYAGNP